jgi:hypothetical protein
MSKTLPIFLIFILSVWIGSTQATGLAREDQIKAAFLYNFANFIIWPEHLFTSPETQFNICVIGKDPFGDVLDITIKNVTVKDGHTLSAQRIAETNIKQVLNCHMLYVAPDANMRMAEINRIIKGKPILTVGENKAFITEYGGMISFFIVNKRVKLAINHDAILYAGLSADANLLRLSTLCTKEGCEK